MRPPCAPLRPSRPGDRGAAATGRAARRLRAARRRLEPKALPVTPPSATPLLAVAAAAAASRQYAASPQKARRTRLLARARGLPAQRSRERFFLLQTFLRNNTTVQPTPQRLRARACACRTHAVPVNGSPLRIAGRWLRRAGRPAPAASPASSAASRATGAATARRVSAFGATSTVLPLALPPDSRPCRRLPATSGSRPRTSRRARRPRPPRAPGAGRRQPGPAPPATPLATRTPTARPPSRPPRRAGRRSGPS